MVCVLLVSANNSVSVKNKPFGAYFVFGSLFGGAWGNQTPDLYNANVALYQLS